MYPTLFHHLLSTTADGILSASPPLAPPPPMEIHQPPFSTFRPSIAVIVGILTTLFSLTFLLLLYAKHCKRSESTYSPESTATYGFPSATELRRHSGVGRVVVESLPVIRFAVLKGEKEGLECAVCLGRFEPTELLRILPKCRHGFHVECVDTWLDAHSTCPLCRVRVEPEDILISVDADPSPNLNPKQNHNSSLKDFNTDTNSVQAARRVSGRYSTGSLHVGHTRPGSNRRSVDSVGCFDIGKIRKDRVLLPEPAQQDREAFERRFSHRIVVGDGECTVVERWSDLRPSDLVFLRSGRLSRCGGRDDINGRSLSEIAGLSRLDPSRFGPVQSRIEEERRLRNWLGLAAERTAKWLKGPPSDNGPSL
ncbi:RING/U-box superfamily protein [Carex rostrata]